MNPILFRLFFFSFFAPSISLFPRLPVWLASFMRHAHLSVLPAAASVLLTINSPHCAPESSYPTILQRPRGPPRRSLPAWVENGTQESDSDKVCGFPFVVQGAQ